MEKALNWRSSGADRLPYGVCQLEAPPTGHLEAVPPLASWGRCRGKRALSRRLAALAAFTCWRSGSSLHSLAGRFLAGRACPAYQEFTRRVRSPASAELPQTPLHPAARTRPDGDMGFPPVLEAGDRRWGPVLLALFLAASRGKVDRA